MANSQTRSNLIYLVIGAMVLGCSHDTQSPPTPPLEVNPQIEMVGGTYTNSQSIWVSICCGGVEAALVSDNQNGESGPIRFSLPDSCTVIPWELGDLDGVTELAIQFVLGEELSSIFKLTVVLDRVPPEQVLVPVFPTIGNSSVPQSPIVSWAGVSDDLCSDNEIQYRLLFGEDSEILELIYEGPGTKVALPKLTTGQEYFWAVEAIDLAGNTSQGSIFNFSCWDFSIPELVLIPAGEFQMGSPDSEWGRYSNETIHQVEISRPFLMAQSEMTNSQVVPIFQWALDNGYLFMDSNDVLLVGSEVVLTRVSPLANPSIGFLDGHFFTGRPQEVFSRHTWYCGPIICEWLNEIQGISPQVNLVGEWDYFEGNAYEAFGFRLATEAEWEYACRAGSETAFCNGPIGTDNFHDPTLDEVGWYIGNFHLFDFRPMQKVANSFGLYDMHGGLAEWCWDWYSGDYGSEPIMDPIGGNLNGHKTYRGGYPAPPYVRQCRSAFRGGTALDNDVQHIMAIRLVYSGL